VPTARDLAKEPGFPVEKLGVKGAEWEFDLARSGTPTEALLYERCGPGSVWLTSDKLGLSEVRRSLFGMSAFRGKADRNHITAECPLLAKSGPHR